MKGGISVTQDFNDIGISRELDWARIRKLLAIGLFAAALHFAGDMILGWGMEDETLTGLPRMLSAYTATSDGGLFAAALLGLLGMTLEGLSMFGIYRLIVSRSPAYAHRYRAGIFGDLIFGPAAHVLICALVFLTKYGFEDTLRLRFVRYFLLPAAGLYWLSLIALNITHIAVFAKGLTPYPRWCWAFSMAVGMLLPVVCMVFGNHPFWNAFYCGWIAFGTLWMFAGLLIWLPKVQKGDRQASLLVLARQSPLRRHRRIDRGGREPSVKTHAKPPVSRSAHGRF